MGSELNPTPMVMQEKLTEQNLIKQLNLNKKLNLPLKKLSSKISLLKHSLVGDIHFSLSISVVVVSVYKWVLSFLGLLWVRIWVWNISILILIMDRTNIVPSYDIMSIEY